MPYYDLTIDDIRSKGIIEKRNFILDDYPKMEISDHLKKIITKVITLVRSTKTEEERRANMINPILFEAIDSIEDRAALFHNRQLFVETLNGTPEYVISKQMYNDKIEIPLIMIVVSKTEHISDGRPQCMGAMIAAHELNEKENIKGPVYGIVTTGHIWEFLKLEEKILSTCPKTYFFNSEAREICGIVKKLTEDSINNLY